MKRTIAIVLAVAMLTLALPALAHEAAYPEECDDRRSGEKCPSDEGRQPAHSHCTGPRDGLSPEEDEEDQSLIRRPLGIAGPQQNNVTAYIHVADSQTHQQQATGIALPGILWLETNGFEGLQDTDWKCMSPDHDEPDEWEPHADTVLI